VADSRKFTQQASQALQSSIDGLVSSMTVMKVGNSSSSNLENQDSPIASALVLDKTHLEFPSFDETNFCDWRAKMEQFFELEGTPMDQRSRMLLLSMDGWKTLFLAATLLAKSRYSLKIMEPNSARCGYPI